MLTDIDTEDRRDFIWQQVLRAIRRLATYLFICPFATLAMLLSFTIPQAMLVLFALGCGVYLAFQDLDRALKTDSQMEARRRREWRGY